MLGISIDFPALSVSAAISAWLTASHPNSEVKQVRAGVVLRWGTTREGPMLRFLFLSFFCFFSVSARAPPNDRKKTNTWQERKGKERQVSKVRQGGGGGRTPRRLKRRQRARGGGGGPRRAALCRARGGPAASPGRLKNRAPKKLKAFDRAGVLLAQHEAAIRAEHEAADAHEAAERGAARALLREAHEARRQHP